jgi:hypothetical protein
MADKSPYWIGLGDTHGHTANFTRIPEAAGAAGIILSGDLTIRGGESEAKRIIEAARSANPRVLAQLGNMDHSPVQQWLDGEGMGIHLRVLELLPDVGLMGVGCSPPTPFGTPSEYPDAAIGRWLDETYEKAKHFKHLLLVCHTPPVDTKADVVSSGVHVGSKAVRAFVERARPEAMLTGHIHESACEDLLGRTQIVNPGDFASGGYAVIGFDGERLTARLKTVPGGR